MVKVSGSMSTSSGVAPVISMAATVATAVWETVTTVLPGPMPMPRSVSASASVPLAQPTARFWPCQAAYSRSKASPSLPRMYQPEPSARSTAASISSLWAR